MIITRNFKKKHEREREGEYQKEKEKNWEETTATRKWHT